MNEQIFFYVNPSKENAESTLDKALKAAHELGYGCMQFSSPREMYSEAKKTLPKLIVTIGGDGTILRVAAYALNHKVDSQIPILGINLGRVGFFTETAIEDFKEKLEEFKNGNYTIEERSTLKCTLADGKEKIALNDFLTFRKGFFSIAHIDVTIDDTELGVIPADGIIISSSAGSTGYSISAGGPVVAPNLDVILVTPICPHSLTARPVVAAFDSVVKIKTCSDCKLSADGILLCEMPEGTEIKVSGSDKKIGFVRIEKRNIFKLIQEKLA